MWNVGSAFFFDEKKEDYDTHGTVGRTTKFIKISC